MTAVADRDAVLEVPRRIVSLVPSLTELAARVGATDRIVGVTDWCRDGAPVRARRVGGTKTPRRPDIAALRPDLVLANAEENRGEDLAWLRDRGLPTLVTFPRRVSDVPAMVRTVARAVGGDGEGLAAALEAELAAPPPAGEQRALMLVWRKPWIAAGADTYVSDLMEAAGLRNALAEVLGPSERWPRIDAHVVADAGAQVVLLPSEPYAFGLDDLPAVAQLCGDVPTRFIDGQAVTWHGPRTLDGLRELRGIARELTGEGAGGVAGGDAATAPEEGRGEEG